MTGLRRTTATTEPLSSSSDLFSGSSPLRQQRQRRKIMGDEGERVCPLCTEEMDLTDQQLKPCKCGYEICIWCWHHIINMAEKDNTEGRCPACRIPYDKEKIVGMAANCEQLVAEYSTERRLKSQKSKPKTLEGRKHLATVRVIQRNLVYIIGIPSDLADENTLERREFFGQYGKILKVSISRTTGATQNASNNSCSVYITYSKDEEAVRCIQAVHGFALDGRTLRACFGTTKYCHAWLRNMPCSNPDCLYLHEIGIPEDSFTKDEILSAYTKSRVHQLTGAANNLQCRSGNVLPSPVDDILNGVSTSCGKSLSKPISINSTVPVKSSPPDGDCGRINMLPAAASWASRGSIVPSKVVCTDSLQEPIDQRQTKSTSSIVSSGTANSGCLHTDVRNISPLMEESHTIHLNHNSATLESTQYADESKTSVSNILSNLDSGRMDDHLCSSEIEGKELSCSSGLSGSDSLSINTLQSLCSDPSSEDSDGNNIGVEFSDVGKHHNVPNGGNPCTTSAPGFDLFTGSKTEMPSVSNKDSYWHHSFCTNPISIIDIESEGVLNNADDQRSNYTCTDDCTHLPHSIDKPEISNNCSPLTWQHGEKGGMQNLGTGYSIEPSPKLDSLSFIPCKVGVTLLSNDSHEDNSQSSLGPVMTCEHSDNLSNVEKNAQFGKECSNELGESSIISNILSLDLDTLDDSLASPHNLMKLLGDTNKDQGALKTSISWKPQTNNQSRFSFARQEDFGNQQSNLDFTSTIFDHEQRSYSMLQAPIVNATSCGSRSQNGFVASDLEDSNTLSSHSFLSSNKSAVSRPQMLTPPGFSIPSRDPPPGFSSRLDQSLGTTNPASRLLNNIFPGSQYHVSQNMDSENIVDVELIDPAILEVGKGMVNSGVDCRSDFLENDPRLLHLLRQQSVFPYQNLRYSNQIGDAFSCFNDPYIQTRAREERYGNSISSLAQLSLQQSISSHIPRASQWGGRNDIQAINDLGMLELLRNGRPGLTKYFPGYEELKFQRPSSSNLYSRAFGI